ncbi:hypothetical protein GCM10011320_58650 [Neoroseomonas lacus]|uniref:Uncharacterized protein n=2 Tax=Neoroseomonas lacus TaxID=287609 RepID=A0A917L510_9PROT|nr:hypothetical protein GCM10011320_58650 [Neoroseomonas lacus]
MPFPAVLRLVGAARFGLVPLEQPAAGHEGHEHDAAPESIAAAQPQAEAHSDLFEVVAVLQPGGALTVTLDCYAHNRPLNGSVTLTLDGQNVAGDHLTVRPRPH